MVSLRVRSTDTRLLNAVPSRERLRTAAACHSTAERSLSHTADIHRRLPDCFHRLSPQCRIHSGPRSHEGGYYVSMGFGRSSGFAVRRLERAAHSPLFSRRLVRHHSHGTRSAWSVAGSPGLVARGQPYGLGRERTRRGIRSDDHRRSAQGPWALIIMMGGTLTRRNSQALSSTRTNRPEVLSIDEYLRERLMPVEGAIPHISGIEMFGNSIPAGTVGGDLFEYINFRQRYDIDARIERAHRLSKEFLEPLPPGAPLRNSVDDHVDWLKKSPNFGPEMETEYRFARSSEQTRVAEDLGALCSTAGVLLVDAQGHGIISAKIASTVHDTFHALMLTELGRYGKTTPELFENLNLRLAQSVSARNLLGQSEKEEAREVATLLYGEVRPDGHFRFANFGHPPPLVFSAENSRFRQVDEARMVQCLALGLETPTDDADH